MIVVCEQFQNRLDAAWYKLQEAEQSRFNHSISQFDLDEICVHRIEQLAGMMKAEASSNPKMTIESKRVTQAYQIPVNDLPDTELHPYEHLQKYGREA